MNRHARRVSKATARHARKSSDHEIVVIHEAGHAVAKALAISELGYGLNEAISHIKIGAERIGRVSAGSNVILVSQGVTFGPAFSQDISASATGFKTAFLAARAKNTDVLRGADAAELRVGILQAAKMAGADISRWFGARTFNAVAGAVAEAIFSKREVIEIFWNDYAALSDRESIAVDATSAGIPPNEAIFVIKRMTVLAAYVMQNPIVWAAVLALAKALPEAGRMDGSEAIRIITTAVSEVELSEIFREGLEATAQFESDIAAQKIVVATRPDGSTHLIKGGEHISDPTMKALNYQCVSPTLQEALWQAFGDGA